jgi:hypothetical protein
VQQEDIEVAARAQFPPPVAADGNEGDVAFLAQ